MKSVNSRSDFQDQLPNTYFKMDALGNLVKLFDHKVAVTKPSENELISMFLIIMPRWRALAI